MILKLIHYRGFDYFDNNSLVQCDLSKSIHVVFQLFVIIHDQICNFPHFVSLCPECEGTTKIYHPLQYFQYIDMLRNWTNLVLAPNST